MNKDDNMERLTNELISVPQVRVIAHCMFDGWIYSNPKQGKYYIGYSNSNDGLINQFKKDMCEVYGLNKESQRMNNHGVTMIEYGSKEAFRTIRSLVGNKTRIPACIMIGTKKIKIAFLRTFFDDEGRVIFSPETHTRKIAGTSTNPVIRKQLITLLENIGISGKENGVDVTITGKENIHKFSSKVGFTPGVRVKRKREFSKWFGIEKNELIKKLLASYKEKS